VHNEIAPLALQFEQELLQDISDEELQVFNKVLEQLLEKARQLGE
jgi:DNA-binding MarR family transcriptional regulator